MQIKEFIESNENRILFELFGLLEIPSISSEDNHKPDMYRAAEYWKQQLITIGINNVRILETAGNPVTFGELIIDKSYPTVLVYGHMDVMPVDPLNLWESDPFKPVIKDDKIWGRGADDDKGQSFMHAKAIEYLIANNLLKCNVKFLIEGEEEIGSPNLEKFIQEHKEALSADIILVSDTGMINGETPAVTVGLRGLCYWQIEVTGPNRDLHSGLFGGAVANPINILCNMIAQCTDEHNHIAVPGYYDDVRELSSKERKKLNTAPFEIETYKKGIQVKELSGESGYTTIERTGIRPTFDVCGIWGGYTGEGAKTVIPSKAFAKISSRLAPTQDYKKIEHLFQEFFTKIAPESVHVQVDALHGGPPYECPTDIPAYLAASKACKEVFGKEPVPVRSGGSIPIISTFEKILGIKSILLGFGLESDAIHSPNENFPLKNFRNGIETIIRFYLNYQDSIK